MTIAISYVHLGNSPPPYLSANIARTAQLYPEAKIILAGDSDKTKLLAEKASIDWVDIRMSSTGVRFRGQESLKGFDLNYWSGYWSSTFNRLLAVNAIHLAHPSVRILHLESDVSLFEGFPFDFFESLADLAWLEHSDEDDIAALLFSPTTQTSKWLADNLLKIAEEDHSHTDMTSLRELRMRFPSQILTLPRFPGDDYNAPVDAEGRKILFDGAQFGDWICGWDPRAHWGLVKYKYVPGRVPQDFSSYGYKGEGNSLFVRHLGVEYRLANLHIHSKEATYFSPSLGIAALREIKLANHINSKYYFRVGPAIECLKSRLARWRVSIWEINAWKGLFSRTFIKR
jgi:hypothetical protein